MLVALATGGAVLIGLVSKAVGLGQEATSVVAGAALGLLVGFGTPYAFDMRQHAAKPRTVDKTLLPGLAPEAAGSVATALSATPTADHWAAAIQALQQDSVDQDLRRWDILIEREGYPLRQRAVVWSSLNEQRALAAAPPDTLLEDDATTRRLHPGGASGAWPGIGGFVVPEQTPQLA